MIQFNKKYRMVVVTVSGEIYRGDTWELTEEESNSIVSQIKEIIQKASYIELPMKDLKIVFNPKNVTCMFLEEVKE